MRKFLLEYFSFSRSETRVSLVVLFLLTGSVFFRLYISSWPSVRPYEDDPLLTEILDVISNLKVQEQNAGEKISATLSERKKDISKELKPVLFDPNTVTETALLQMGLPDNIVKNLIRYRAAGGKFREKSDLLRIYGMNDSVFELLSDYIKPGHEKSSINIVKHEPVNVREESPPPIDLNTADSTTLRKVLKIPTFMAGRIIRFRDILGGYYSNEQLFEVYGMDTVLYNRISMITYADTSNLRKMSLNKADVNMLSKHPYISRQLARDIMVYRKIYDGIMEPEELVRAGLLSEKEFAGLRHYLY